MRGPFSCIQVVQNHAYLKDQHLKHKRDKTATHFPLNIHLLRLLRSLLKLVNGLLVNPSTLVPQVTSGGGHASVDMAYESFG